LVEGYFYLLQFVVINQIYNFTMDTPSFPYQPVVGEQYGKSPITDTSASALVVPTCAVVVNGAPIPFHAPVKGVAKKPSSKRNSKKEKREAQKNEEEGENAETKKITWTKKLVKELTTFVIPTISRPATASAAAIPREVHGGEDLQKNSVSPRIPASKPNRSETSWTS
jgi:hypothetical protein